MPTRYHLYDPDTDTHYRNGGYIVPAENPKPASFKWLEGFPPEGSTEWQPPAALPERLEAVFLELGNAAMSNPSPEALASLKGIMEVDTFLTGVNKRFGAGVAYTQAAFAAITELGELPGDLEAGRQLILAEIQKEL